MSVKIIGQNPIRCLLVNSNNEVENIIMYEPGLYFVPPISKITNTQLKVYQSKGVEKIGDIIDISQYQEVKTT
jgi:hypothetical protein